MNLDSKTVILGLWMTIVFIAGSWLVGNQPVEIILNQEGEIMEVGGGTRFPNGISADSTSPSEGEVRGTTLVVTGEATMDSATFSDILNTDAGFVEGGQLTISTTSATYTLTQAEMQDVKVISLADTEAPTQTFTLPATSTMTTMIPNAGDAQSWIIDNLHTAAATTSTFAAGTGIDIDGLGANDDVLNGGVSGMLVCWRLVSTDVRCSIREHVDAG